MQKKNDTSADKGYPQAAIFVKKGESVSVSDVLKAIETFANETSSDSEQLTDAINSVGVDKLGIPNVNVAVKSLVTSKYSLCQCTGCKRRFGTIC